MATSYDCIDPALQPGEFHVTAFVRTGNDAGQGGCVVVGEADTPVVAVGKSA